MARKLILLVVFWTLVTAGLLSFLHAKIASADYIGASFLSNAHNGSDDLKLGIWKSDGSNILLESPQSQFQIYRRDDMGTNVKVTVKGICAGGLKIDIGWNNNDKRVKLPGDCSGSDAVFNVPIDDQTDAICGSGIRAPDCHWYTKVINIQYDTSQPRPASQHFNIDVSPGAKITFNDLGKGAGAGDPNSTLTKPVGTDPHCGNPTTYDSAADSRNRDKIKAYQNACGYPGNNAFSVIPETGSDDTFILTFSPSCNYASSDGSVYLKWFDGDHGTGYGGNLSFTVKDLSSNPDFNSITVNGNDIGGEGTFAFKNIGPLTPGHRYQWIWSGINSSNGVQIWVPFSGFSADVDCPTKHNSEPTGKLTLACPSSKTSDIKYSVKGRDPDHPNTKVPFRIVGAKGTHIIDGVNTNDDGTTPNSDGTGGFNPGSTYYLQLQDDDGSWGPAIGDGGGNYNDKAPKLSDCFSGGCNATTCCSKYGCEQDADFRMSCTDAHIDNQNLIYIPTKNSSGDTIDHYFNTLTKVYINGTNVSPGTQGQPDHGGTIYSGQVFGLPYDQYPFYWKDYGYSPLARNASITIIRVYKGGNDTNNDGIGDDGVFHAYTIAADGHTINYDPTGYSDVAQITPSSVPAYSQTKTSNPCYAARCSLTVTPNVSGSDYNDGVNGGVRSDAGNFTVTATITSEGETLPRYWPDGGPNLGLSMGYDGKFYRGDQSPVNVGGGGDSATYTYNISLPPPGNGINKYLIDAYPDYYGKLGLQRADGSSAHCGAYVYLYKPFTVSANAHTDPDTNIENLTGPITYYTNVGGNNSGVSVDVPTHSTFGQVAGSYKGCAGKDVYSSPLSVPSGGGNLTHISSPPNCTPSSLSAGDKYCAEITLTEYNHGYVGFGGDVGNTSYVTNGGEKYHDQDCVSIKNQPYVHFYGSDVSAGGGFGEASQCSNLSAGGISTYTNSPGIKSAGSGVQIGALAIGPIKGFSSAQLRGTAPVSPTGLSFSNTTNVTGGTGSAPNEGGSLGGDGSTNCVRDRFKDHPDSSSNASSIAYTTYGAADGSSTRNSFYFVPTGGKLKMDGGIVKDNSDVTIYVKGDIEIAGNITFEHSDWGSIDNIPSIYIIAEGGTIFIDQNVTQLDGVYVSQPGKLTDTSPVTGGYVNTCANNGAAFTSYGAAGYFTGCNKQLVVNGAFVAQHVALNRTYSSLRYAQSGERFNSAGTSPRSCGPDAGTTPFGDCAAEIFNFSPEMYLTQPELPPGEGPTTGTYDYVTSLAPVL